MKKNWIALFLCFEVMLLITACFMMIKKEPVSIDMTGGGENGR